MSETTKKKPLWSAELATKAMKKNNSFINSRGSFKGGSAVKRQKRAPIRKSV